MSREQIEEEIERRLRERHEKKWSDAVANTIKNLEEETMDDCKGNRLCYAKIFSHMIMSMGRSIEGWYQWLNFEVLDNWTDEEFKEHYEKLKKLVIEWLKLDMEITKKKEEETIERQKEMLVKRAVEAIEQESKTKKTGPKPEFYVA